MLEELINKFVTLSILLVSYLLFIQKEEDLSSETPSPSLVCKTDRVGTPEIESDTYEVCSDCNCKTSDQELNAEQQNPEELLQIKKGHLGLFRNMIQNPILMLILPLKS